MSIPAKKVRKLVEVYAHLDDNGQYQFLTLPEKMVTKGDVPEAVRNWFEGNRIAPAGFFTVENYNFKTKQWVKEGKHDASRAIRRGNHFLHLNRLGIYSQIEKEAKAWIQARGSEALESTQYNLRDPDTGKTPVGEPIKKTLTVLLVDMDLKPTDPNFVVGPAYMKWQRVTWPDWQKQCNLPGVNLPKYIEEVNARDAKEAIETMALLVKAGFNEKALKEDGFEECMRAREYLEKIRKEAVAKALAAKTGIERKDGEESKAEKDVSVKQDTAAKYETKEKEVKRDTEDKREKDAPAADLASGQSYTPQRDAAAAVAVRQSQSLAPAAQMETKQAADAVGSAAGASASGEETDSDLSFKDDDMIYHTDAPQEEVDKLLGISGDLGADASATVGSAVAGEERKPKAKV